jgi:hypothetical protein
MKYIITENRLNNIVLKWLDDLNLKILDSPSVSRMFFIKDQEVLISYDKRNGYTRVVGTIIGEFIHSLFNLEREQIEEIIKIWLETRYDLEPRFVEFK